MSVEETKKFFKPVVEVIIKQVFQSLTVEELLQLHEFYNVNNWQDPRLTFLPSF